jgi:hypothetical protein
MGITRDMADMRGKGGGAKNLIINGSMVVSQRATSSTGITTAGYYTVDRQQTEINNAGTWTMTQSDDVPDGEGFAKSFKYDCTTADTSLGTSHYFIHRYSIEGQDLQELMYGTSFAKPVTISFFVKSNKTGTYVCELQQLATDGSYPRSGKAFTINSADTWEKKIITINGNTAKLIPDSNARGMDIMIWMAAGTDFTSGTFNAGNSWTTTANERAGALTVNIADNTANEILFTGLQMEIGTSASSFQHEDFGTTLEKCKRYCYVAPQHLGYTTGTNSATLAPSGTIQFSPNMRAAPTCTGTYTPQSGSAGTFAVASVNYSYVHVYNSSSNWNVVAIVVSDFKADAEI